MAEVEREAMDIMTSLNPSVRALPGLSRRDPSEANWTPTAIVVVLEKKLRSGRAYSVRRGFWIRSVWNALDTGLERKRRADQEPRVEEDNFYMLGRRREDPACRTFPHAALMP